MVICPATTICVDSALGFNLPFSHSYIDHPVLTEPTSSAITTHCYKITGASSTAFLTIPFRPTKRHLGLACTSIAISTLTALRLCARTRHSVRPSCLAYRIHNSIAPAHSGFNIAVYEYSPTIESLWTTVKGLPYPLPAVHRPASDAPLAVQNSSPNTSNTLRRTLR